MGKEIKQQRMNARDEASQLFCWCIVTAMNQKKRHWCGTASAGL